MWWIAKSGCGAALEADFQLWQAARVVDRKLDHKVIAENLQLFVVIRVKYLLASGIGFAAQTFNVGCRGEGKPVLIEVVLWCYKNINNGVALLNPSGELKSFFDGKKVLVFTRESAPNNWLRFAWAGNEMNRPRNRAQIRVRWCLGI